MFACFRDPLPNERETCLRAIQARNEKAFSELFDLYPNVLWGKVSCTLPPDDRLWALGVLQKRERSLSEAESDW